MNQHTANFEIIQRKTTGIYQIRLTIDDRCYVGSSTDVRERWYHHRSALDHQKHHSPRLQNAWNKYGPDAFRFELLEECDAEILLEREQLWMDKLNSVLNLMRVAMRSGHPQTLETRGKIAATSTGRTHGPLARAKVSAAQKGRPKSSEHREKLAQAQLAKRSDLCANGHEWTPENTGVRISANGNEARVCNQCNRDKAAKARRKRAENGETCSLERCDRTLGSAMGLCQAHYIRLKKYGDVMADVPIMERKKKAQ